MLGKTVLLYTTDRSGSRSLTACLRAAGNEVVVVDEPRAATDLIAARVVDIVLFDYSLSVIHSTDDLLGDSSDTNIVVEISKTFDVWSSN